jgi:hypothetical protein
MSTPFDAAIAELERQLEEIDRKGNELRGTINNLCQAAGLPVRYLDLNPAGGAGSKITQIKDDTFYGKKQTTAMREYLEMRKVQSLGPAKPRDIFEALKAGGYQFEAKDEGVALVGMRALLRTQPNVFHKLPQGTYGLTAWYPDAKRQRAEHEAKATKKKRTTAKDKKPKGKSTIPDAAPEDGAAKNEADEE